jgi:two-component system CheB/CheR fusion protein
MAKDADRSRLRKRAEGLLKRHTARARGDTNGVESRRLVHELEVHQIELELQNEELRNARVELERSLARYTELFDFAPIGYASLDADGHVRAINHAGAELLQAQRAHLIGRPFVAHVAPSDHGRFLDLLERARTSDRQEKSEVELATPRPAMFLRLTAGVPQSNEFALLLAFSDITERRRYEEALERSEETLRRTDRHKDEFMATLSHELRNPLAPIRNCIFLLEHGELGTDEAHQTLQVMERQVSHLSRLVDDLLDVTRIQRGKVHLQTELIPLDELLRSTVADQRGGFDASGLRLDCRIEASPVWVRADSARLIQVLTNVLGNAEKFTPRGGRVMVSLHCVGDDAVISVRDTGAGIAADVLERLFQPFTQAPQTVDRARGGLGLGLSMVKGLVELHGGKVKMASAGVGHGSELTITLPVVTAPVPAVTRREVPSSLRRRIFVIEDNADAADTLSAVLTVIGHEVEVAYDGTSALEQARKFGPDIVLCDIGLPGMDGYEVARAFRADKLLRDVYMVALSGYALPEDLRRASEAGFNRHVAKPPSMQQLTQVIAAAPRALSNNARPRSDGEPSTPAAVPH